jgi:flagellar biosynthetic protein FlhB
LEIYLGFDLQLFAGEKTEPATPHKRQEARKKGQVFKSNDLNSAVIILAVFTVIYFGFPYMLNTLRDFIREFLISKSIVELTPAMVNAIFLEALNVSVKITWPILAVALVAGLASNLFQVGFIFSSEPLGMKLERLNPVEGFKRIFSKRAMVELLKSLFKLGITAYIVYQLGIKYQQAFPAMMDMEANRMTQVMIKIIFEMAMKIGAALLVLGVLDYIYQRWEHENTLKMSKHEVKEEYKQMEGHPQLKARQKQKQREMAMSRMMSEVPKADVVITNPTHFAVALRYVAEHMDAPVVVAKGQNLVAQRIKEIARESKVEIVEERELARELYYFCDLGMAIPENLYQAVAQVLAFVYSHNKVS